MLFKIMALLLITFLQPAMAEVHSSHHMHSQAHDQVAENSLLLEVSLAKPLVKGKSNPVHIELIDKKTIRNFP